MGRHISTAEFEDVATAFPGVTGGAIRNRIGILRAKQKKIYEDLGWDLPGAAKAPASAKKAKVTPAKRTSDDSGEGEGGEPETSSKKKRRPRKKVGGAADEEERKERKEVMGGGSGGGVKKEVEEEEEEV
ncbi:hypothetical protein B5807_10359 [Epicoccum nigrum]|uniref:Uncharacterized protein n=1 Tax=Epicoccum nigrum TaxID=105696 RepID=A0A1Y2LPH8_EPING|nr:hypothetical protein B5807_10359 [Epicoccum nigrum]